MPRDKRSRRQQTGKFTTTIAVDERDALDVAKEQNKDSAQHGKVGVLNLAARDKPCGAFEEGAPAQEESLSRRSTYAFSLRENKILDGQFETVTRGRKYHIPHDAVVSSPGVRVIRAGQGDGFRFYRKDEQFEVHMIACAGYDLRTQGSKDQESLQLTSAQRKEGVLIKVREILRVAAKNGDTCIVLGALGCGVFESDDKENKKNLIEALNIVLKEQEFRGVFKHISIAITGHGLAEEFRKGLKEQPPVRNIIRHYFSLK